MLNFSFEKPNFVELGRLSKLDEKRVKPQSLLITLSSKHQAGLVLAKAEEKSEALSEMGNYLLRSLSKDDAIEEYLILKNRRDPDDERLVREKLNT